MAINRVSLTSSSITENTDSIIEIRTTRPDPNGFIDPPDVPGRIIGYYNGSTDRVELYIVAPSGTSLLRV